MSDNWKERKAFYEMAAHHLDNHDMSIPVRYMREATNAIRELVAEVERLRAEADEDEKMMLAYVGQREIARNDLARVNALVKAWRVDDKQAERQHANLCFCRKCALAAYAETLE